MINNSMYIPGNTMMVKRSGVTCIGRTRAHIFRMGSYGTESNHVAIIAQHFPPWIDIHSFIHSFIHSLEAR
jgi:hypothetical protein